MQPRLPGVVVRVETEVLVNIRFIIYWGKKIIYYVLLAYPGSVSSASRMYMPTTFLGMPL